MYTYGDTAWGDLLTAYDGVAITYDEMGNPLSDGTWTYTWEHGRQLASMTDGTATWTYTYDANGMRTSRSNGTDTYSYVYNGSKLMQMTVGSNVLTFTYDGSGNPSTVTLNGATYYYITNLQGDVVEIRNASGSLVCYYAYDAWGNIVSTTTSNNEAINTLNPLRYRGYVFDTDTNLYYLQSRYYNPEIGRFLNADALVSTGQGILGNNMFAYCNNNPVCCFDPTGLLTDGKIHDSVLAAIILDYMSSGYYFLSMSNTMIYYNGENVLNGWGYCDLYDSQTGEVWELKKASCSYTCTTKYAKRQLGKYVNGRLANDPGLVLSRGGELVSGKHTFTITDEEGTYTITYWQECQGILRYSYIFQKNNKKRSSQGARASLSLIGGAIFMVGLGMAGGPTTVEVIPFAPAIIKQKDMVA